MYFGVWVHKGLKGGPAAPIETFARFQVGFLSSEDSQRILSIFIGFHRFSQIFMDFNGFSLIFIDFGAWVLTALKGRPAAL